MALPNRVYILQNLQDSLAAIAGDGDVGEYKLTAVTVERVLRDPQVIPVLTTNPSTGASSEATPWFGCVPNGEETVRVMTGGWREKRLRIVVAGAVALTPGGTVTDPVNPPATIPAAGDAHRSAVSASIIDDISYALCGTQALSERGTHVADDGRTVPNAISTVITSQWTDEGQETPVVGEHGRVIAYAVVRAEITYQERRGHA